MPDMVGQHLSYLSGNRLQTMSCGLDLGLHLVERLVDGELAAATAAQIAHPYTPAADLSDN